MIGLSVDDGTKERESLWATYVNRLRPLPVCNFGFGVVHAEEDTARLAVGGTNLLVV